MDKINGVHLYKSIIVVWRGKVRREYFGYTHATLERWCSMARVYGRSVLPFADGGWMAAF